MIKIEVLFSEVCNLYGDLFNIKYLQKSIKEVECVYTSLTDEPKFVTEDVDLIYMAPMTEKTQEIVIQKLKPYKDRIKELIEKNKVFLLTGNAFEVFGKYIENEDGTKIDGLDIIPIYAKRRMMNRFNSLFLGKIEDIKIVGFKAQFSMSYGDNSNNYVFESIKGSGINTKSKYEGYRVNNFIGTYLLGPILILNPYFTKYILKLMGREESVAFEDVAIETYKKRLEEFEKLNREFN